MNHRQSSTITIYRKVYVTSGNTTTPTDVAQVTVPITAACRRVIRLMSEDSVTLSFALPSEDIYQPKIGDFVDDELFGKFYLAQEALCEYNKATGGYEYNLTFVRDYWMWNNHILMFVATRHNVDETHTGRIIHYDIETRTETSWMLTDTLAGHCYMIARNLSALGFGNVSFDITADYADEVRYIAYDNIHICDALTAIANEYECEWWVTENALLAKTIHFGKCEGSSQPYDFRLAQNVESMTVSRDQSKYANRIAAYGSTKNLPVSYHRSLKFKVTEIYQIQSSTEPIDTTDTDNSKPISIVGMSAGSYIFRDADKPISLSMLKDYTYVFDGVTKTGTRAKITYGEDGEGSWSGRTIYPIIYDNECWLRFDLIASIANDFVVGTEFTLNIYDPTDTYDGGLIMGKIPDAWWLDDMDNPSSLQSLGERRLMLPDDAIWVTPTGNTPIGREIVEDVAIFDYIFPRCFLRVTSVTERHMKGDETVVDDGSSKSWDWIQYAIGVERIDGEPFPFLNTYQTKDTELEMVFVSEIDEQDAYDSEDLTPPQTEALRLLAGMTFKVGYDDSTSLFTIIHNEDYGAKLPNGILKPSVNDVLVLTGWDVKAMDSLGLIDEAEQRLKKEAQKYVNALQEGQFTFGCNMMSQWPFSLASGGSYNLPQLGDKVTIHHAALRLFQSGSWVNYKTSRIIGIEAKLDMPYDTPLVTVGETEAYSRLKMMERAMSGQGHGVRTKLIDDIVFYEVVTNLANITSNAPNKVKEENMLIVELTTSSGYVIKESSVVVTMGGNTLTGVYADGVITIASVTGDVNITASAVEVIVFEDAAVKAICVNNWGGGVIPGEITPAEAAAVTTLAGKFYQNTTITKFNELRYFTGLTSLNYNYASSVYNGQFRGCTALTEITIPAAPISDLGGAFRGCTALNEVDMSSITATTIALDAPFREAKIATITLPGATYNGTMSYGFRVNATANAALVTLNFNGTANLYSVSSYSNCFTNQNKLKNITGTITNIRYDIDLSPTNVLTVASAIVLLNGLYDFIGHSSSTRRTITFKSGRQSVFEADSDFIAAKTAAEAKGWTIAYA